MDKLHTPILVIVEVICENIIYIYNPVYGSNLRISCAQINLLYQDMLRKRQELERLQRAGKFKYEYDSDEETDGGTWEHRLRLQEMEATQRWAEELTKKAEGKHHIGDFLPPDELERFLEKVRISALCIYDRE